MTKKLFIETIEQIRLQEEHDNRFSAHLGKAFPDAFEANLSPDNRFLRNQIIKLLEIKMGDQENRWIEYFISDLDFGREFTMGMVTDENKEEVDLSDVGRLWEFLQSSKLKV